MPVDVEGHPIVHLSHEQLEEIFGSMCEGIMQDGRAPIADYERDGTQMLIHLRGPDGGKPYFTLTVTY